jgi:hypothetical protein
MVPVGDLREFQRASRRHLNVFPSISSHTSLISFSYPPCYARIFKQNMKVGTLRGETQGAHFHVFAVLLLSAVIGIFWLTRIIRRSTEDE